MGALAPTTYGSGGGDAWVVKAQQQAPSGASSGSTQVLPQGRTKRATSGREVFAQGPSSKLGTKAPRATLHHNRNTHRACEGGGILRLLSPVMRKTRGGRLGCPADRSWASWSWGYARQQCSKPSIEGQQHLRVGTASVVKRITC